MKTKSRKIWSIPIAVLALVLMLAGALAVSGIVQAQAANIVKGGGDVVLGSVSDGTAITTMHGGGSGSAVATPAVPGLDDDEAVVAVLLSGADAALFDSDRRLCRWSVRAPGAGNELIAPVAPNDLYDHDGDGNDTANGGTAGQSAQLVINSEETKAVYTFNVTVWFDSDTAVDSGRGYRAPVVPPAVAPADTPDVASA